MLDRGRVELAIGRARGLADQRPAARLLEAGRGRAAATAAARDRLALARRHQQCAQAVEAIGRDQAQRHQLGQRLLELRSQQAALLQQLVEERGAVGGHEIDDGLGARAGARRIGGRRGRAPERRVATGDHGDRGRAHGRRPAVAAGGAPVARRQADPGGMARQAACVEPGRPVVGEPGRQDLAFPRTGGRAVAFELGDDGVEGLRSLDLRIRRHALPLEEKAQEVARGHGLDLGAQPLDRVVMDAGEQPTLAPFVARRTRREAAAHGEALGFQRRQSRRDLAGLQA